MKTPIPEKDQIKAALKQSIVRWENNRKEVLEDKIPNIFSDECPLCALFGTLGCEYCPIDIYDKSCSEPESTWIKVRDASMAYNPDMNKVLNAVDEEIVFLKEVDTWYSQ